MRDDGLILGLRGGEGVGGHDFGEMGNKKGGVGVNRTLLEIMGGQD